MAPTKEQVREWMNQRQAEHTPPPTPEQVRRELGWDMERGMDKQRQESAR